MSPGGPSRAAHPAGRPGAGGASAHLLWLRLALVAAFAVALLIGFFGLPRGDEPIPVIARRAVTMAIPEWHTTEAVNAIVYGTRGFDTIGESFLLVAAVVSVVLVARKKKERPGGGAEEEMARRERDGLERGGGFPEAGEHGATKEAKEAERAEEHGEDEDDHVARGGGPDPNESMTVVTRIATHALLPVLAMAALVIVSWGYSPGGGFPAAVALCGVALLVYASRGLGALGPVGNPDVLEVVEVVASLGLICVGLGGFIGSGSVTQNFLPLGVTGTIQGGGELQAMSGIEVFEVAGGILLVLVSLLTMRHDWSGEDDGGGDGGDGGGDDSGAVAADEAGVGARGEGEAGVGARGEGEDEAGVGAEGVPA